MKVTPSVGSLTITLPDATLTSLGTDIFFDNAGGYTFTVLDSAGGSVATLAAGQVKYLYLDSNTTAAGSWRVTLFGASSSNLDASQLAGSGLLAIGSQLAQASVTTTITTNTTLLASDRANLFVNTGGVVALTLPLTSVVGGTYFVEVRNQGTGAMTLTPVGGETVDGLGTVVLQLNESCFVNAGAGAWYTIGRGRNQQFNFTQLTKTVTGGTTTLTLSEASNVVQTYSGVLASAETVVLPAVVQVYYIANTTTGAYTFTIKNPATGSTLVLPQGQSAVVFSDGTNVTNTATSIGGITSLLLAAGAAASPSLAFVNTNNGIFAPTGLTVGVSANGAEVVRWGAGQELAVDGTVTAPAYSFLNSLTTGWYSPAANQIALAVAGVQKFFASATSFIINKVTITPPATSATLTIADGKTLTASNTLTLTATDGSTLAVGTGGTLGTSAYTATATPTTLGLVIGTNVQAYDADLTTWAGITPGANVGTALAVAVGTAGGVQLNNGSGAGLTSVNAATLGGKTFADPGAIGTTPAAIGCTTLSATGLLDLSGAAAGQIKFPATQNASSDVHTLDDYDEYTAASAACTGAITTAAVWKLTKKGNDVTLTLPNVTGIATAIEYFRFGTFLPAKYRPTALLIWPCGIKDNNSDLAAPGCVYLETSGLINVYKELTTATAFTNGATAGFSLDGALSVSWTI
jgi:hypothetical protein